MAQYWYDFTDMKDGEVPDGFKDGSPSFWHEYILADRTRIEGEPAIEFYVDKSHPELPDQGINYPLIATDRVFGDCDILVKAVQRTYHSDNSLYNGGRMVTVKSPPLLPGQLPSAGLGISIGASDNSSYNRVLRNYLMPNTSSNVGTSTALPVTPSTMDIRYRPTYIRIQIEGSTVRSKVWFCDMDEPSAWHLTYTTLSGPDGRIALHNYADPRAVVVAYAHISVATDGDPLLYTPPIKTFSGLAAPTSGGKEVVARGPRSGAEFGRAVINSDGSWTMEVIDSASTPSLLFFIHSDGRERAIPAPANTNGFIAGTFPDGITKVEGVPTSALLRVFVRDPGGPEDGILVAEVESNPDGTWVVSGLDPDYRYDVICRYPGYNDMVLSNVTPVVG